MSGQQRFLKQEVLASLKKQLIDDDENSFTRFGGRDATIQAVSDELRTVSMWGDCRLVLVEDADDFVSKNRPALEKLTEKPPKNSTLILDVNSWPKTTRLYKLIQATGLEVECADLKGPALLKWVQETTKNDFNLSIGREAAALLIELVGDELGMINSELAKLASYASGKDKIEVDDVKLLVGGWRMETTWAMTDAARDNDLGFALGALDQLLTAGEAPLKLLGGIAYVFKKFSVATDLSRQSSLEDALRQAGTFPQAFAPSSAYLRRLGRTKAGQILSWLREADSGIKGECPLPERMQLEKLLAQLAGRLN